MADTKPTINPCNCGCGKDAGFYKSGNRKEGIKKGDPKKYIVGHWLSERRDAAPCQVEGCDSSRYGKGMCRFHYDRMRWRGTTDAPEGLVFNEGRPCAVDGCDRIEDTKGVCGPHYRRILNQGSPLVEVPIAKRRDLSMLSDGYGWCVKCDEIKPLSEFHKGQRKCVNCWMAWFQKNKDSIYASNRESAKKSYYAAKSSGRCAWRNGRGCELPARPGRVLCEGHARLDSLSSTARSTGRYDESYSQRGLGCCWICGTEFSDSNKKHNDHLIPKSLGGPDETWNMAPACAYCNMSRNNTPLHISIKTAKFGTKATIYFPDEYLSYLAE